MDPCDDIMRELRYIGHSTPAVHHLLSGISDDSLLCELFMRLDPASDAFYRELVGVEMMSRGLEPGVDGMPGHASGD